MRVQLIMYICEQKCAQVTLQQLHSKVFVTCILGAKENVDVAFVKN